MKKILILAANPRKDLDLRREIHILKSTIERSQTNDQFEVEIGSAVRSKDLQELFLKHEPRIVHFCGHGTGEQGLVLEDDRGQEQFVSTIAISDLFKSFSDKVECVLLNACYSEQQADAIKEHVNYSIGMSQSIRDDAAIIFARGFYQALAYGKSIPEAFELGCNAIKLQIHNEITLHSEVSEKQRKFTLKEMESFSLPEYLKPQLKVKLTLTLFPKEVSTDSSFSPDLNKLVPEEIARKRYREDRQEDFGLGRNVANLEQHLTQKEYRRRQVLLNQVRDSWIKGVLENSLHSKVLFELDIKERRNAIQCPFSDLEELSLESDKSFEWLQASDIFEEMGAGRTLLILGEPGTGKTISLLKLAERLIKQAEQNSSLPIPVVLNLSSWASKRQPIVEWLVTELKDKYPISKALSRIWIEEEQLILLLDGLDEVTTAHRNECVRALNQFIETHSITEIVICSRIQDYEALSERLKLRSAICIQPLSSEYIDWYFDDVGEPLEGLKTLLKRDEELEEFAKTPLILSIMTLTYENYTSQQILQQLWQKENRYQILFNDYIEQMFKRRGRNKLYRKGLVISWLIWIADHTKESSFLIEHLQPEQLDKKSKSISLLSILVSWRSLYTVLCLFIFSLAVFLFSSLVLLFVFHQSFNFLPITKIINDWVEFSNHQWILCEKNSIYRRYITPILLIIDPRFASIYIPILFFSFVYNKKIKITEKIDLSLENLKTSFFQSLSNIQNIYKIFFKKIKLEVTRISSLVSRQSRQEFDAQQTAYENNIRDELVVRTKKSGGNPKIILIYDNYLKSKNKRPILNDQYLLFSITSIIIMLLLLPFIYLTLPVLTLIHFLLNAPSEIIDKTTPNRGIWNSLRYSILYFILCNIIAYVLLSIFNSNVIFAYCYGYFVCLLVGLSWGGFAVIQHLSLRIILYVSRKSPWNYTHFLDYTKELLFIQNAGGHYIFTHRMLMEHFAQMKKDESQYF